MNDSCTRSSMSCPGPSPRKRIRRTSGAKRSQSPAAAHSWLGFAGAEAGAVERPGEACAFQSFAAERLPLDLVVLVDASGSMADPVEGAGRSKWQMAQEALSSFIRDPGSAGLGLGLQFFPLVGGGTPCAAATDCGYPGPQAGVCGQRQLCLAGGRADGDVVCGAGAPGCPTGT